MSRLGDIAIIKTGYNFNRPTTSLQKDVEDVKVVLPKDIWSEKVNYEPWLTFFITSLQKQKRLLEEKISHVQAQESEKLSGTAKNILELFAKQPEWTVTKITDELGKNMETVKKSVQSLIKKGYLIKHGTTKAVFYTLKKPL